MSQRIFGQLVGKLLDSYFQTHSIGVCRSCDPLYIPFLKDALT